VRLALIFVPAIIILMVAAIVLAVWVLAIPAANGMSRTNIESASDSFRARKAARQQAARWQMMCMGEQLEKFEAMREAYVAGKLDPCNSPLRAK
jgi:hypothetical protein